MAETWPDWVEELDGSPELEWSRDGGQGTRRFKIPWGKIETFAELILPSPFLQGSDIIIPPARTFSPATPQLYAKTVSFRQFRDDMVKGDDIFPAQYDWCEATVSFEGEEYDQEDPSADGPGGNQGSGGTPPGEGAQDLETEKVFLSHKVNVGGEFLTWPSNALQYSEPSDPSATPATPTNTEVPQDAMIGVVSPQIEHTITWHHAVFPPWAAIRRLVGHVNAYTFSGAKRQTMLFLGVDASREITNNGARPWTLDYKFVEKDNNLVNPLNPYGWNHFLRTRGHSAGTFARVFRRPPGGFTTISEDFPPAGAANILPLRSKAGFPTQGSFFVFVDRREIMQVTQPNAGDPPNSFRVLQRGQMGTASIAGGHAVGKTVQQCFGTQITTTLTTSGLSAISMFVANNAAFPEVGQMRVFIHNSSGVNTEILTVVERKGNLFKVLRNTYPGDLVSPHWATLGISTWPAGSWIVLMDMPIYPINDLRFLFVSGLITG